MYPGVISIAPNQVATLETDVPDKPVCEGESGVCGGRVVHEGKCMWHERGCVVSMCAGVWGKRPNSLIPRPPPIFLSLAVGESLVSFLM